MLLHVMRHGPAEDHSATGRDFDRALSREGREVVAKAARLLHEARAAHGRPVRLLVSPLRRALETAEIVARAAIPPLEAEEHPELAADQEMPLALVRSLASAGTDAILVGHQPTVEELVRELAGPIKLPGGFRTAMVMTLELDPGGWKVVAVTDPHR